MITALIMAGGSGERFWPLSTKKRPKQLLNLVSDKTMIRETVERILPIIPKENIFIGTNEIQYENILKELYDIPVENILIEPHFRDTAAAIGYGTMMINKKYQNPIVVVLASDHLISDVDNFNKVILYSSLLAKRGNIITLGIKPSYPETGYGYIKVDDFTIDKETKVLGFFEKPSYEKAVEYYESKKFLWNGGIFIFSANSLKEAFKKYATKHYEIIAKMENYIKSEKAYALSNLVSNDFQEFPKISIDYAVMEKTDNLLVIPVDFGWNDIGSFPALRKVFTPDEFGNVIRKANVISLNSSNNIVITSEGKTIALLGVHDLVIAEDNGNILICRESESQNIKALIKMLKEE